MKIKLNFFFNLLLAFLFSVSCGGGGGGSSSGGSSAVSSDSAVEDVELPEMPDLSNLETIESLESFATLPIDFVLREQVKSPWEVVAGNINVSSRLINSGTSLFDPLTMDDQKNVYFIAREGGTATIMRINKVGDSYVNMEHVAGKYNQFKLGDGSDAKKASIGEVSGMCTFSDGSLLFSDRRKNLVRKVDANGRIRTVAGYAYKGNDFKSPENYGDNHFAVLATLLKPAGVACGQNGSFFIADQGHHRIRKVDTNGIITTLANIDSPKLVSLDRHESLLVVSYNKNRRDDLFRVSFDGAKQLLKSHNKIRSIAVDFRGNIFYTVPEALYKLSSNGAGGSLIEFKRANSTDEMYNRYYKGGFKGVDERVSQDRDHMINPWQVFSSTSGLDIFFTHEFYSSSNTVSKYTSTDHLFLRVDDQDFVRSAAKNKWEDLMIGNSTAKKSFLPLPEFILYIGGEEFVIANNSTHSIHQFSRYGFIKKIHEIKNYIHLGKDGPRIKRSNCEMVEKLSDDDPVLDEEIGDYAGLALDSSGNLKAIVSCNFYLGRQTNSLGYPKILRDFKKRAISISLKDQKVLNKTSWGSEDDYNEVAVETRSDVGDIYTYEYRNKIVKKNGNKFFDGVDLRSIKALGSKLYLITLTGSIISIDL